MRKSLVCLLLLISSAANAQAPLFCGVDKVWDSQVGCVQVYHASKAVAGAATDDILNQQPISGTPTPMATIAGKRVCLTQFVVNPGATPAAVTINSKGGSAGTAQSGPWSFGSNGGMVTAPPGQCLFKTNDSQIPSFTTGAGSNSTIQIGYAYVE